MLLVLLLGGCSKVSHIKWDCSNGKITATITVHLDYAGPGGKDADKIRVTAWPGDRDTPRKGQEFEVGVNNDTTQSYDIDIVGDFPSRGTYTVKSWSALNGEGWSNGKRTKVKTCVNF